MPRPGTPKYWIEKIRGITEKRPKLGALDIQKELRSAVSLEEARKVGMHDDPPSARTIGRYMRDFRDLAPAERAVYRQFRWPDAFDGPGSPLPWECARTALDLLAHLYPERPDIADVLRFWRFTQSAPDAPIELRWSLVIEEKMRSLIKEAGGRPVLQFPDGSRFPFPDSVGNPEVMEQKLAFEFWKDEAHGERYRAAITPKAAAPMTAEAAAALKEWVNSDKKRQKAKRGKKV